MAERSSVVKLLRRAALVPPLRWWRRFYLAEVLVGLGVTATHFFRNLGRWTARYLLGRKDAKGAVTFQYPEERRPLAPRLRGLHRLVRREDGSPRCVACMMCETVCPAHCIYIVAAEHPNPDIEKYPERFDIDLGKCVFCGFCVEVCPEDAIRMDTGILEFSAYSREGMIYTKETLLALEPAGADGLPRSTVPQALWAQGGLDSEGGSAPLPTAPGEAGRSLFSDRLRGLPPPMSPTRTLSEG